MNDDDSYANAGDYSKVSIDCIDDFIVAAFVVDGAEVDGTADFQASCSQIAPFFCNTLSTAALGDVVEVRVGWNAHGNFTSAAPIGWFFSSTTLQLKENYYNICRLLVVCIKTV